MIDESTGDLFGIGELHQLYLGPTAEAGESFVRMMHIALDYARRELKGQAFIVEDRARKMTNRERLRLPVAQLVAPGHEEIRSGRRRFQNIKGFRKRNGPS